MQQAPLKYDPATGRANPLITNAAHYRDKLNDQWCYNPWTREFRHAARYHDFQGLTLVETGAEPDPLHLAEVLRIADLCAFLGRCQHPAQLLDVDTLLVKIGKLGNGDYTRYLRLTDVHDRADFDALVSAARPLVFDDSEI